MRMASNRTLPAAAMSAVPEVPAPVAAWSAAVICPTVKTAKSLEGVIFCGVCFTAKPYPIEASNRKPPSPWNHSTFRVFQVAVKSIADTAQ